MKGRGKGVSVVPWFNTRLGFYRQVPYRLTHPHQLHPGLCVEGIRERGEGMERDGTGEGYNCEGLI